MLGETKDEKEEVDEKPKQHEERIVLENMIETPFFKRHESHMPATIKTKKKPDTKDAKKEDE